MDNVEIKHDPKIFQCSNVPELRRSKIAQTSKSRCFEGMALTKLLLSSRNSHPHFRLRKDLFLSYPFLLHAQIQGTDPNIQALPGFIGLIIVARCMSSAYAPSKPSDMLFYHFARKILSSRGSHKADQAFESGALHCRSEYPCEKHSSCPRWVC